MGRWIKYLKQLLADLGNHATPPPKVPEAYRTERIFDAVYPTGVAVIRRPSAGLAALEEDDALSWDPNHRDDRRIPAAVKRHVFERDGGHCRYCGTSEGPFHYDHVIPYSLGGSSTNKANIVLACASCNMRKGTKLWKPVPLQQHHERTEFA